MTMSLLEREQVVADLEPYQFYPRGDLLAPMWLGQGPTGKPWIDKATPIVTMGSCFAEALRTWLTKHSYNVLDATGHKGESCTIFSTALLRQEVDRVFGAFTPTETKWRVHDNGSRAYMDPHRHKVFWPSEAARQHELEGYLGCMRAALMTAQLLILTVGQAEVWHNHRDGSIYPMVPPDAAFDQRLHRTRLLGYDENLANLRDAWVMLRQENPSLRAIVTVSPVPLKATWRDMNAVVANTEQKAIIRAAVGVFVEETAAVQYFPSFEMVTQAGPGAYKFDNRHIRPGAVSHIMQIFAARYMKR